MIETPASVMISRDLAKEVDFFSVGTNDLTQYTLAIDRQNAKLDRFYDPHHPAILAMIKMAAENAHAEGACIGICGELGADLELTQEFLIWDWMSCLFRLPWCFRSESASENVNKEKQNI